MLVLLLINGYVGVVVVDVHTAKIDGIVIDTRWDGCIAVGVSCIFEDRSPLFRKRKIEPIEKNWSKKDIEITGS